MKSSEGGVEIYKAPIRLATGLPKTPRRRARFFEVLLDFKARPGLTLFVLLLVACLFSIGYEQRNGLNRPVIRSDGEGYYSYLPLYAIAHTLDFSAVAPYLTDPPLVLGFRVIPQTGKVASLYPVGTAICIAPFFALAHGAVSLSNGGRIDALGAPYQVAVLLAGLAWFALGLTLLWRFLFLYFSGWIAAFSILVIIFASSVFHYAVADPSFSHIYSFSLVAVVLYTSAMFWRKPTPRYAILAGAACGLLFDIRNYNILYVAVFFHPLLSRTGISEARRLRNYLLLCAVSILVAAIPELLVLKYYYGSFYANSYQGVPLNYFAPQILNVLFSVRKGVFFWSPALLFGLVGLCLALMTSLRPLAVTCLAILGATAYIISIWPAWPFGDSFGHRGFVDAGPLFAFGFAVLLARLQRYRWRPFAYILFAILVTLNTLLLWSYWWGILPGDFASLKSYRYGIETPIAALFRLAPQPTGDSRWPDNLRAELHLSGAVPLSIKVYKGNLLGLDFVATNIGKSTWSSTAGRGLVALSIRFVPAKDRSRLGTLNTESLYEWRSAIERDVSPNEQIAFRNLRVVVPLEPGSYVGCAELLSEGVAWFRSVGPSTAVVFDVEVLP